jgi:hypothetical protein
MEDDRIPKRDWGMGDKINTLFHMILGWEKPLETHSGKLSLGSDNELKTLCKHVIS